jgi:uncharacterized protein (DUF1330 family)
MTAYVIVDIAVTDPVRYEAYKERAGPTVTALGGRYIVRGGTVEVLEGQTPFHGKRLVILEFPDTASARAWLESPEYREARQLRHATARTNMIVVEGV